jgi:hypothetical protein
MRTAVLIHGCHLQADFEGRDWEDIVWGSSGGAPSLYGRATMGLHVALRENAGLVIFSTGASERDGVREGEYTFQQALKRHRDLAPVLGWEADTLLRYLNESVELDLESKNTQEECERNLLLCAARHVQRVFLVSSPWHIERCHAVALSVAETMRQAGHAVPEIRAVGSYGLARGVTILEPPHRGDRPRTRWHELGKGFFRIPEDRRQAFEAEFETLVSRHST